MIWHSIYLDAQQTFTRTLITVTFTASTGLQVSSQECCSQTCDRISLQERFDPDTPSVRLCWQAGHTCFFILGDVVAAGVIPANVGKLGWRLMQESEAERTKFITRRNTLVGVAVCSCWLLQCRLSSTTQYLPTACVLASGTFLPT